MARNGMGLALAMVLLVGGLAVPASASEVIPGVVEESGATTLLDGGNRTFLRFGQDAWFGVLWGTAEHPNFVYLVAIKARYLGVADVYENGRLVDEDRALKVYTIYAVKLEHLFEFNDTNGDGIANYSRNYDGERYDGHVGNEPLYKAASLSTAWEQSEVVRTEEGTRRRWDFSLTARDLPYRALDRNASTAGALDEVTFTFHLATDVVRVDNASLPQIRIDVVRRPLSRPTVNLTRDGNLTWSGDRLQYRAKWDQRFVGWDFDAANTAPGLLLEMHAMVVNRIPLDGPDFLDRLLLDRMHEGGAIVTNLGGERRLNETEGTYRPPRRIASPLLRMTGEWSYIGDLTWVSETTVDGRTAPVYAQIQGVVRSSRIEENAAYSGFVALVGMSFPRGDVIDHDPLFASEAFVQGSGEDGFRLPVGLIALVGIAAASAVIVGLAVTKKKSPNGKIQEAFRQEQRRRDDDWGRYYQR